jgi:hypothetical protein
MDNNNRVVVTFADGERFGLFMEAGVLAADDESGVRGSVIPLVRTLGRLVPGSSLKDRKAVAEAIQDLIGGLKDERESIIEGLQAVMSNMTVGEMRDIRDYAVRVKNGTV